MRKHAHSCTYARECAFESARVLECIASAQWQMFRKHHYREAPTNTGCLQNRPVWFTARAPKLGFQLFPRTNNSRGKQTPFSRRTGPTSGTSAFNIGEREHANRRCSSVVRCMETRSRLLFGGCCLTFQQHEKCISGKHPPRFYTETEVADKLSHNVAIY